MNFEDLTPELKEKARTCKTPEELVELARENGHDLSDEELEQVAGGWGADIKRDWYSCSDEVCHSLYCASVNCHLTCSSFSYGSEE